jgi:glycosyltransferase 2 family protein
MFLGLAFVLAEIWNYRADLAQTLQAPALYLLVFAASLFFALAELFLAFGWFLVLRAQGISPSDFTWRSAWSLYGKSQIAKYIPGNVFHIVGRHMLARQSRITHGALFLATILEIIFLVLSAALISLLSLGQIALILDKKFSLLLLITAAAAVIFLLLFALLRRRTDFSRKWNKLNKARLSAALLSDFLFLVASCMLFIIILICFSEPVIIFRTWPLIAGAYTFSWAVGFIVPGAPGGLGVREGLLLTLLAPILPGPDLLLGMLVFRIVNTLGDFFFYLMAIGAGKIEAVSRCRR